MYCAVPVEASRSKKRQSDVRLSTAPHTAQASFAVTATLFNRNIKFLVDSGADVSILPATFKNKAAPLIMQLTAANGSTIKSYGCIITDITFPNLRRCFKTRFIVAEVTEPLLGAEFFKDHKLLIDVSHRRLIDSETQLSTTLIHSSSDVPKISLVNAPNDDILQILHKHSAVFDINAPRPMPPIEFRIETTAVPKPARAYRLSPDKIKAARTEIDNEIKLGRMVRSSSQYASPFFPVRKPDGTWRFVADYTRLNSVTVKDNYVPPRIDDLLSRIPANCVFSKLDLQKAFFLIPIAKEDQPKTAVITPFGLYEYTVMSMGLKNASQTLQRYVDTVLASFSNTLAYCDDILLFTSKEEHPAELDKLLTTLHNAGLVVNQKKSQFCISEVHFLGHTLLSSGYQPTPEKVSGMRDFKVPATVKQVRRFLGMINFYRKFIPNATAIQQPLTSLTHKGAIFSWTSDCQTAFEKLIQLAIDATQLRYPTEDDEYVLTTDASGSAVGAALHSQNGPIGFFCWVFSTTKRGRAKLLYI